MSGRSAPRLLGEDAIYDVFLSYRVKSDYQHAETVYKLLTEAGFKVWWDKAMLEPGVSWEEGFCDGLIKSKIFIPIISKFAINHPTIDAQNFTTLQENSSCDNVLLEYWLALELHRRGFIDRIYPLLIGQKVKGFSTGIEEYNNFFDEGGYPDIQGEVIVASVERLLTDHLDRLCLGTPLYFGFSVSHILKKLLKNQGKVVEGDCSEAFNTIQEDVAKMVSKISYFVVFMIDKLTVFVF